MKSKGRPLVGAVLAGIVSWGSLTLSAQLGLQLPEERQVSGVESKLEFDYASHRPGFFDELTREFIARILGLELGASTGFTSAVIPARVRAGGGLVSQRFTDIHPLTNDNFSQARHIPGVPYTAKTDTRRATREANEANSCAAVGDSTVWYSYEPAADIGLTANTFGSNYATALGVFSSDAGNLTRVGCDSDGRGNSIVAFAAKKDTKYVFQIVGPAGGGDLVFNLEPQGVTTLASLSSSGGRGDGASFEPTMSGDGRFVAFTSQSSNLGCSGNPCFPYQTYVRDRQRSNTTIVSVDSNGHPGNLDSIYPNISGNGRYVAFESGASNLVPGDTNGVYDIFVHDLVTRHTERVSVSSTGEQLQDSSPSWPGAREPSISWDGRFVAFETRASNLVPNDHNGTWDAFVHDRLTRKTERVSVSSAGQEREGPAGCPRVAGCSPLPDQEAGRSTEMNPSISGDGRFVAFRSFAANLVPSDDGLNVDTFVHDRMTHTTERVSVSSSGEQGNFGSSSPGHRQLSFDGRYVAFNSFASNLTPGDTGFDPDVFVHDRLTHKTIRVSVSSSGDEALVTSDSPTGGATISEDGRYVAFHSDASNLVPSDDNGVVDVFVHDLLTGTTVRVSVTATGEAMEGSSSYPYVSADGAHVTFHSAALAPTESYSGTFFAGDQYQVYVHER
jgi:Tol biopolymer transport system component